MNEKSFKRLMIQQVTIGYLQIISPDKRSPMFPFFPREFSAIKREDE